MDDQYLLTPAGKDLEGLVMGLGAWGAKWQFGEPREEELDPELLMWWVHDRLDLSMLPARRVVLEFSFVEPTGRYWIVSDAQGPSVCNSDPGFEVDVRIRTELSTMYQVWLGRLSLRTALKEGRVEMQGPSAMVRRMPDVLQLSPVAAIVADAQR